MKANRVPRPGDPAGPPEDAERRAGGRGAGPAAADWFYGMLRFVGRHVQGFFGILLTILGAGFIVSLVAGFAFAGFGHFVAEGATQAADVSVLRWIEARRTPLLDEVMLEITTLGALAPSLLIALVAGLFLWLTGHKYSVYLLLVSLIGGSVLNHLLKDLYGRPRPIAVEQVADVSSLSFPSGHAMTAFIMYGTIAYLVARIEPTHRLRVVTAALGILMIALIGLSRMYLGVHYPSDVLAGFIAGASWLAFVIAAMKAVQYYADRNPDVERKEKDLHAERERALGMRG